MALQGLQLGYVKIIFSCVKNVFKFAYFLGQKIPVLPRRILSTHFSQSKTFLYVISIL